MHAACPSRPLPLTGLMPPDIDHRPAHRSATCSRLLFFNRIVCAADCHRRESGMSATSGRSGGEFTVYVQILSATDAMHYELY